MAKAATATTTTAAAARSRSRSRSRDRKRRGRGGEQGYQGYQNQQGGQGSQDDSEVREGDELMTIAGILDIRDNHAYVRTTGYLPGPSDVHVTMNQVRKYGLRKGDAVTGQVKAPREGEEQHVEQVQHHGGGQTAAARATSESEQVRRARAGRHRQRHARRAGPPAGGLPLTPLYPDERLRLETAQNSVAPRIIDLVSPIGKGQRGLIVAPPKAGKTIIMQQIANAITANNPEVHLMVVLVDERPEEVTDMQRTVKGEVIASDLRPPWTTPSSPEPRDRAREASGWSWARTSWCCWTPHPSLPRLQPRGPGLRSDPLRRCGCLGAVPAQALLRRGAQHRARRLAHDPRLGAGGDRLKMDEVIFEESQGHRQHGAAPVPPPRRQANLPGGGRQRLRHPPRGGADGGKDELSIMWKLRRASAPSSSSRRSSCCWSGSRRPVQHRVPHDGPEEHPRAWRAAATDPAAASEADGRAAGPLPRAAAPGPSVRERSVWAAPSRRGRGASGSQRASGEALVTGRRSGYRKGK